MDARSPFAMSVEFKDYYQILGVPATATDDDIKKAFRTLARKYHPDVAIDKSTAEEKFKELNEAHEVLSNLESRQKYDQLCAHRMAGTESRPTPGWARGRSGGRGLGGEEYEFQFEGTGLSDFFEQVFGGGADRSRGGTPFDLRGYAAGADEADAEAAPQRGRDIQGDILITLDEVLKGAIRTVSVRRTNARTGQEETQTCSVRIPAGVQAGQSIRVAGKGGQGLGSGHAGDIFLRVRLAEHPDWRPRGPDLIGHLELAPWEAVLGSTVTIRTLEGRLTLRVPAGTQQGQQLRVRGKGLPARRAKRGDLYVGVTIEVPRHIGKEEERLWKQLATESTFAPREAF